MEVKVYYPKKKDKDTEGLSPYESLLYSFVNPKSYGYAVLDGEEVPEKYLTDEYTYETVSYDDSELNSELQDLQSKGYKGTIESLAKLKAMSIPIVLNTSRAVSVLPSTNLTYVSIRDLLNLNGGVVNNDVSTSFKVGNNINYYSRYKPMSHPVNFIDSDAIFKEADWGYNIPSATDLSTFINNVINDKEGAEDYIKNGWSYNRPVGGVASPFRLGDFRRYNPDSVRALFNAMTCPTEIDQNTASFSVGFQSGTFQLSDFNTFNTYKYFGVAIAYNQNQNVKFKTGTPDTISFDSNETSKLFPNNGTYTVYGFMTGELAQNLDSSNDNYATSIRNAIALPISTKSVIKKYAGAVSYFKFEVLMTSVGKTSITFDLYVTNVSEESRTVSAFNIKYGCNAVDDYGNEWEQDGYQASGSSASAKIAKDERIKLISGATYSYAAYRYLVAPWYVNLIVYYPNSENQLVYAGNGQGRYE